MGTFGKSDSFRTATKSRHHWAHQASSQLSAPDSFLSCDQPAVYSKQSNQCKKIALPLCKTCMWVEALGHGWQDPTLHWPFIFNYLQNDESRMQQMCRFSPQGLYPQIYTVFNLGMTIFNFHLLLLFLANLTRNWVIFDEKMERQA